MTGLTREMAGRLARIALGHVTLPYPYKLDQVLTDDADCRTPAALHPIFHGSFDWHSCVHSHWLLAAIVARFPDLDEAASIAALFDAQFTADKVAGERAFLDRPTAATFERPYGWGWLLALHAALPAPHARMLEPLARAFADRFADYLPRLTYPVRAGTHANTAFALVLAHGWAARHDAGLAALIADWARDRFGGDRVLQLWEPSGEDFLSPALCAAVLMARVDPAGFGGWFARYLPAFDHGEPAVLVAPLIVSDRSDYRIAHLDGLNLSRAWCWRAIAAALLAGDDRIDRIAGIADAHLATSLPHIDEHYAGTHWLASFALLALLGDGFETQRSQQEMSASHPTAGG